MAAVAVWAHQPMPGELLADRLERGWTPTKTALKGGDRILGYARCIISGEHRAPEPG